MFCVNRALMNIILAIQSSIRPAFSAPIRITFIYHYHVQLHKAHCTPCIYMPPTIANVAASRNSVRWCSTSVIRNSHIIAKTPVEFTSEWGWKCELALTAVRWLSFPFYSVGLRTSFTLWPYALYLYQFCIERICQYPLNTFGKYSHMSRTV